MLEPCGIDEAGFVVLKEVSMTFTETELGSPVVDFPAGDEVFLRLTDAHGQGVLTSFWRHSVRPFNDRIKDMGWILKLEVASTPEGL